MFCLLDGEEKLIKIEPMEEADDVVTSAAVASSLLESERKK